MTNSFAALFFNNLFGTIAGSTPLAAASSGVSFIPTDSNSGVIEIRGGDAQWIGLQNKLMQLWAYQFCYPLASVIDRLAEADTNGEIEVLRSKGKGKEDYATSAYAQRMNKLFKQPNPLQTWQQFRGQQLIYKRIFGFCPVLPIMPAGMDLDPSYCIAMINLPPWLFEAKGTGKMLGQSKLDGFVKEYSVTLNGVKTAIPMDKLFILEDSFLQDENIDFVLPKSRLIGLDMAISNICAAMEADNVLLKKRGPLGFISHDAAATKDAVAGYIPLTKTEKEEVQTTLQQYGLNWNQFQWAITRQPMRWNPVSFDVKQLGTKETVTAGERAICHRFGYSYILYEDSGATYANQSGAHKALYQNVVIPNAEKDLRKYEKFFQAEENACEFEVCFDDLPILQEDEKASADAIKALNDALLIEYKNGLITLNQWRTARGYDTTPDGDVYYTEPQPANPNNPNPQPNDPASPQGQGAPAQS